MRIIDDLLRIKAHRERQAELALARATRGLRDAVEATKLAQQRLDEAHIEFDRKKNALYKDLFSRLVQLGDLNVVRSKLEKMDAQIKKCQEALQSAHEGLSAAEAAREEKRIQYVSASKQREKYTELSLQAQKKQVQLQEKKEDLELDEVSAKLRRNTLSELHVDFEVGL